MITQKRQWWKKLWEGVRGKTSRKLCKLVQFRFWLLSIVPFVEILEECLQIFTPFHAYTIIISLLCWNIKFNYQESADKQSGISPINAYSLSVVRAASAKSFSEWSVIRCRLKVWIIVIGVLCNRFNGVQNHTNPHMEKHSKRNFSWSNEKFRIKFLSNWISRAQSEKTFLLLFRDRKLFIAAAEDRQFLTEKGFYGCGIKIH